MVKYWLFGLLACALLTGCAEKTDVAPSQETIVTTLPVLGLIIEPIAEEYVIDVLLKDGQSPHSFQVKPSEAKRLASAPLLVYASPIIDGWAAELVTKRAIPLWDENHDEDAHYWTDPVAVQSAVRRLSDSLCEIHPNRCAVYRERATSFTVRIDSVARVIETSLQSVKDECFLVAQPFMTQFLDRFGIRSIGPLQPLPGHDASPRTLSTMMEQAKTSGCAALLVQRAVDNRAMNALAKDLNIPVRQVDHLGTGNESFEAYLASLMNVFLPTQE